MDGVFGACVTHLKAMEFDPIPSDLPLSRALFINCLQRTQTQQLLKMYLMIALKNNYKDPEKNLPN